jgi:cytochrome d ubiquinol oxidase subunit II
VVPPDYTLWDAASAYESQLFLLLGLLFVAIGGGTPDTQ